MQYAITQYFNNAQWIMKLYFARTWTNLDKYARLFQNESRFSLSNSALSFWPLCSFPSAMPWHRLRYPAFNGRPSAPTYSQFWTIHIHSFIHSWLGQMVMLSVLCVKFGKPARHRIKPTSFSGPLNLYVLKWPEMSFWQLSNGITRVSPFRTFLSKLHCPPAIALKEHNCDQQPTSWSIIWYVAIDGSTFPRGRVAGDR